MALFSNIAKDIRRNKVIYLLCIPIVAWYIIFSYIPMTGIIMSFQDFSPVKRLWGSKWVELKNFTDFFSSIYFTRTRGNTLALSLLDLVFGFPAPIIFALLLNEVHHRLFKRTVQTLSYLPYFISMVVICGIIVDFMRSGGVISNLLASLTGTASKNLLGDPKNFRAIYIVSGIWQGVGYGSIIYLSALSGVDAESYEAARIDGASAPRRFFSITMPCISPIIFFCIIMQTINAVQNFTSAAVITEGGPLQSTYMLGWKLYVDGFKLWKMGYASATAWVIFGMIMLFTLTLFASSKHWVFYGDET